MRSFVLLRPVFVLGLAAILAAAEPAHMPVLFLSNAGQDAPEVHFTAQTSDLRADFETGRVRLRRDEDEVYLEFLGGSASPVVEALDTLPGAANFLVGPRSGWITGVPMHSGVAYRSIYRGIDVEFRSSNGQIKSEYIVQPGADPRQLRLRYRGAGRLELDEEGGLRIHGSRGHFGEHPPIAYQRTPDGTRYSAVEYVVQGDDTAAFRIAEFDRSLPLYIDPALSYSTYFGGSRTDTGTAIALDSAGNAYVAGYTDSTNIPTLNSIQNPGGSVDAFVFKLNSNGTQLLYATFIGGSGDDRAYGIGVDSSGSAYVCGSTSSSAFPVASPIQPVNNGARDGFLLKMNPSGNGLIYSTYFGGSANDSIYGCTIDAYGQFYAAGETASANLTTRFPFQAAHAGGIDAFAVKLNGAGALVFSTYFGGSGDDSGRAIAIHPTSLTPYLAGSTTSPNLPILNPAQPLNAGGQDAFLARFNGDANGLIYSTYLGGASGAPELIQGLAADSFGNAYAVGVTGSSNFPVLNMLQGTYGGGQDAFVAKYNSGGGRLFVSYLGGSGADVATSVAIDSNRRPYVAGYTSSRNFPTYLPIQAAMAGAYDAFVAQLDVNGSPLAFSTYLGGTAADAAYGIAINSIGEMFLTGTTGSTNFPTQAAYRFNNAGGSDIFAAKITAAPVPPTAPIWLSLTPSAGSGNSTTFQIKFSDTNGANDFSNYQILVNSSFTGLNACHAVYNHSQGLLYLLNDNGTAWLGGLPPGALNTISNSQCSIALPGTSVSALGNELTLNLAMSFTAAYAGTRNIYLLAIDNGGLRADWTPRGTWTIP